MTLPQHLTVAAIAGTAALALCRADAPPPHATRAMQSAAPEWKDLSSHRSEFVQLNGVRLNYLDWGGDGPPVVMIHGLGDDPHIFDDLAEHLRDRFHIVAYARRGHGSSDVPDGPYDSGTLIEDLRQLLDHLKIQRTHLVGWSMGGNEVTAFAGEHPDRVDRIVYLESGYDWSAPGFLDAFGEILGINSPGSNDVKSLDAFRKWYRAASLGAMPWSNGLEAYLRDMAHPDATGGLHPVPPPKVFEAFLATAGAWPRDYTKVRAPALALYATTFFPTERNDVALAQKLRDFETNTMVPFRARSKARIKMELNGVKLQVIPGRTHMSIGVKRPDRLAVIIGDFLQGR